ncbi:unnamed protein product [Spirodela intermedia]|uniref:Uncharacterized protein n=1 Tax=Spirodela intermedia TaxID=51605 RepID=A0A7I8JSW1_SPIIN|nr:unnamed protein product [Spirodela intermedia]CAA6672683.1 unnamed protein product [Spirodela intermedia]
MAIVEMQQAADCPTFKLVIVGYGGTGETTFAMRHLTGEFEKKYELMPLFHQFRVEVHPWTCSRTVRRSASNSWDTAGQEKFGGLKDGSEMTVCAVDDRRRRQDHGQEQVAVKEQGECEEGDLHRNKNLQYYEISTKSNFNFDKPFLYLARKFAGLGSLNSAALTWPGTQVFIVVGSPALAPPEVQIDLDAQRLHEADLAAAAHPLPDEDDDAFD